MKHCHFSILYNEYEFLTQKLPFLYDNFDQIIFYDLNVVNFPYKFSDDGSHEYIKDYPDPENKIILIEKTDLTDIKNYHGASLIGKRKMFAVGSKYINDDIDVYWCTDMDEFFNKSLIEKVEKIISTTEYQVIFAPHVIFWKNSNFIFTKKNNDYKIPFFPRIARHKKKYTYGHCNLQTFSSPGNHFNVNSDEDLLKGEFMYHFSCVGEERMKFKLKYLPDKGDYMNKIWNSINDIKDDKIYGYPNMHPNPEINFGVKKFTGKLPPYIDKDIIDKTK